MAQVKVYSECAQCSGTGMQPDGGGPGQPGPVTCTWPGCNGTGFYEIGYVELDPSTEDLQDKHQDILDKLDEIGFTELDPSTQDLQDKHQDILDKLDDVMDKLNDIHEAVLGS